MAGTALAKALRSKEVNVMGDCGVGEHDQPTGPEMQQKARSHEP